MYILISAELVIAAEYLIFKEWMHLGSKSIHKALRWSSVSTSQSRSTHTSAPSGPTPARGRPVSSRVSTNKFAGRNCRAETRVIAEPRAGRAELRSSETANSQPSPLITQSAVRLSCLPWLCCASRSCRSQTKQYLSAGHRKIWRCYFCQSVQNQRPIQDCTEWQLASGNGQTSNKL